MLPAAHVEHGLLRQGDAGTAKLEQRCLQASSCASSSRSNVDEGQPRGAAALIMPGPELHQQALWHTDANEASDCSQRRETALTWLLNLCTCPCAGPMTSPYISAMSHTYSKLWIH